MIKEIILILLILFTCTQASEETPKILKQKSFRTPNNFTVFNQNKSATNKLKIPPRSTSALGGSEFMQLIKGMSFENRENEIRKELLSGNIPNFLRELVEIDANFEDAVGNSHQLKYWVMPDYLAIGSDSDFCRIPMGPITAQIVADSFYASMPTRKLVNDIYQNTEIKLAPVTYAPVGNNNEKVDKFIQHNFDIQVQFNAASGVLGQLVGGIKKDVVISNKIVDPSRPNHVTIYGWHKIDGEPIQPLTNIHINTYVDYSHGIRLIYSDIIVDGDTTTIQKVLRDNIQYKILSDETGVMNQPTYLINTQIPPKPTSFGIRIEKDGELKILIHPNEKDEKYNLFISDNGIEFNYHSSFSSNEFSLTNIEPDSIVYVKLTSENNEGVSTESEVLSSMPKIDNDHKVLIVNGFDRNSDGNTLNFIRQHGLAITANGFTFESATNEAIIDGIFFLTNYKIVDYILGDESTVDETFSNDEQIIIAEYLEKGGNLFVSGSEIAWDLDYKGSSTDKFFFNNYFKSRYSADAPGGIAGTYYSTFGIDSELFNDITTINFDNGTNGTYDVKYADAIIPINGAKAVLQYKNVTIHNIAGISYEGFFGSGTVKGKLVYIGFPFESIYPEETRNNFMKNILNFFEYGVTAYHKEVEKINDFRLEQNYPNPFNPTTTIEYTIPDVASPKGMDIQSFSLSQVTITVYDALGREVQELVNETKQPGRYTVQFDGSNLTSGIYFVKMIANDASTSRQARYNAGSAQRGFTATKKIVLAK